MLYFYGWTSILHKTYHPPPLPPDYNITSIQKLFEMEIFQWNTVWVSDMDNWVKLWTPAYIHQRIIKKAAFTINIISITITSYIIFIPAHHFKYSNIHSRHYDESFNSVKYVVITATIKAFLIKLRIKKTSKWFCFWLSNRLMKKERKKNSNWKF